MNTPQQPSSPRPRPAVRPRVVARGPGVAVMTAKASSSGRGFIWLLVLAAIGGGGFWFMQSGGTIRFAQSKPSARPAPAAKPVAAAPEAQTEVAKLPPAFEALPPESAQTAKADIQARIEVVRLIGGVGAAIERGDFSGAAGRLDAWLGEHAPHPQRTAVEHEVARLRVAAKALPELLAQPGPLIGAQIPVGNAVWPVSSVKEGKLTCRVQAQFGVVERAVEVTAFSEAARVQLMQRADAVRKTALAPAYLLGLGKADAARAAIRETTPDAAQLRAGADEVAQLARDGDVLEALDRVESLIGQRQFASAQAQLDQCTTTFANHDFLTAFASKIDGWRAQIASAPAPATMTAPVAAATPADGYPGLPVLSLSATIKAGDPDGQKLAFAAQWAASTGHWSRHFTALKETIGNAAGSGPWQQHSYNLESLLSLATPVLAVEQAKFVRAVGVATLDAFAKEDDSKEFLNWLFARPRVMAAFSETIQPQDKTANALMQWRTIWVDDEASRDSLSSLAIACALVFDVPVKINRNVFGFGDDSESESTRSAADQTEASALARFRFFRDSAKKGSLKVALNEMTPWELVWVVDAPVPDSELVWAQKHVNYSRREWSKAYGHIRYRMDRATQGVNPYKAYTLAEIEKEGGICGDQAYFATMTAKANGIPAMIIGGEGDRGGHAWFGYGIARNDWNLNTGRYADNYAAGTTRDPQTGRTVKEHELRQLTDPARRTAGYDKSEKLVALASLLNDAGKRDLATLAYEGALRAAPKNYDAWVARLDNLAAANVPSEEWLRESARMRTTFHEFSDLVQEIDKRQAAYLTANGDTEGARKLVHRESARMERKDAERTDLILDSLFREADLAEKSGDGDAVGRVYRDALKSKGSEVVGFKKIAGRYYGWAKDHNKGPDVARELVGFFDRKHNEPTSDVFAIGAYRGVLKTLSGMAKDQSLDELQRRLDRREEKLKELEDKLGKLQSKGADR